MSPSIAPALIYVFYLAGSVSIGLAEDSPAAKPVVTVEADSSPPRVQDFLAAFQLRSGVQAADQQYFDRMVAADDAFESDRFLEPHDLNQAREAVKKLRDVERHVGHGRFSTLNFESVFRRAAMLASSRFTVADIRFLRDIFNQSSVFFDFNGPRVSDQFLAGHDAEALAHYPAYGEYLLKGEASDRFERLKVQVGSQIILTSGYRGHPKQMLLYLEKVLETEGNLSRASRNRAPAGYSFHFSGDFDVGDARLGEQSFSRQFLKTSVYQQMVRSGWVSWRYPSHNLLGVRFEPWHIIGVCDTGLCLSE